VIRVFLRDGKESRHFLDVGKMLRRRKLVLEFAFPDADNCPSLIFRAKVTSLSLLRGDATSADTIGDDTVRSTSDTSALAEQQQGGGQLSGNAG
jgi:hypothetical protein